MKICKAKVYHSRLMNRPLWLEHKGVRGSSCIGCKATMDPEKKKLCEYAVPQGTSIKSDDMAMNIECPEDLVEAPED